MRLALVQLDFLANARSYVASYVHSSIAIRYNAEKYLRFSSLSRSLFLSFTYTQQRTLCQLYLVSLYE